MCMLKQIQNDLGPFSLLCVNNVIKFCVIFSLCVCRFMQPPPRSTWRTAPSPQRSPSCYSSVATLPHPQSQGGLPAAPALSPARKKRPYVDLLVRCFHLERANALVLPAGGPRPRSPPPVFQRQRFRLVPGDEPVDDEAQH